MVLPDTGSISFQQIQTELGGSNPISLNEYYSDNSSRYSYATAIPKTGNPISISHFRGVSKASVPAETTYSVGRSVYVNEQNGITKEINIYTDPYWTQTIRMYVQPQFEWGWDHEWLNKGERILLSTSTIYAHNYASFNVSYNTNDGNYYVTLIGNLAPYGEPNRHQYIYWRRTGEFFVNIVYS